MKVVYAAIDNAGNVTGITTGVPIVDGVRVVGEWLDDEDPRVLAYLNPKPAPRRLSAYRIIRRIEEAGKIAEANALLDASPALKWRFQTAPGILVDDPDLLAGIQALGLDPAVILAPE